MDKRDFLKTSGAIIVGGMFSSLSGAEKRTNWSGNYTYSTDRLYVPKSVDEVRQMVKSCDKLKALGTRHSFNGIADDDSAQISLQNLKAMTLDADNRTVTIEAGVRYGDLAPYLDQHGWALHNLASLPHISVVGSRSTATHGSGNKNGNLATAVTGFEFVTANGDMVEISREKNSDRFEGAVVDLGAIGVVTKLTLKVQPTFQVSQTVYENLSFDQLEHNLEQIFASGYSVSLFTDWQHHRATQVWIKDRVQPGETPQSKPEFFGATRATRKLHPIAGVSAENTTEQMGVPGPWYERLPHFRMNFTPSRGNELQTEYFVPRERGYQAILAVEKLRDHITPHLFITEFRTIDADHLWMSMAYQRPSLAIHFTWKPEWAAVRQILPMIEEQLAPFDPRPHWAKLFTLDPARLQHQYVKFADYRRLVKDYDPNGKFRNEYLNHNIFT